MTGERFRMRRLLCALPLAALGCSIVPTGAGDLQSSIDGEARKLIDQGVADRFVIGVIKAGRTLVRGYGDPRPEGGSVFQIGSLTKLFTVATLLSLARDGVVSLDDDLAESLGGRAALAPGVGAITLRQLASHTSGLPPMPQPLLALPRDEADPYRGLDRDTVYSYLRTAEGLRPAGRFDYSNYGMGLLGHVLEERTGASLEALMAARIFGPLSMASTVMTPREGPVGRLVPGMSQDGAPAPIWRFGALEGAGGLCAPVQDMLAFIAANLDPEGELGPMLAQMRSPGGRNGNRLGWLEPSLVDQAAGNRAIVWHNGRVGGHAAYLSIDPDRRSGVVILSARSAEITIGGVMLTRAVRLAE